MICKVAWANPPGCSVTSSRAVVEFSTDGWPTSVTGFPAARAMPGNPYSVHGALLRFLNVIVTSIAPAVPCDRPVAPCKYRLRQPAVGAGVGEDAGVDCVDADGAAWVAVEVLVTVTVTCGVAADLVLQAAAARHATARVPISSGFIACEPLRVEADKCRSRQRLGLADILREVARRSPANAQEISSGAESSGHRG